MRQTPKDPIPTDRRGFTLIELSIVLVIIGLVAGSIVIGSDLIKAAGVRATIAQVEKYRTSVNTFRGKYGYLPGDIPNPIASSFGFQARGATPGTGDGDGTITGIYRNGTGPCPFCQNAGETVAFWTDLSAAGMVDGSFTLASATASQPGAISGPDVIQFFPAAKIGQGNYFAVWSGGIPLFQTGASDRQNYFVLSGVTTIWDNGPNDAYTNLTVMQAYNIDTKIDDGMPQRGKVFAMYLSYGNPQWAGGDHGGFTFGTQIPGGFFAPQVVPADDTTCYDNHSVSGGPTYYSTGYQGGNNQNCALSFQFQ